MTERARLVQFADELRTIAELIDHALIGDERAIREIEWHIDGYGKITAATYAPGDWSEVD